MTMKKKLRSQAWFARQDKMGFYYRSWLKNRGFPQDQFDGRPVIGICNTWSELTPCNSHFRTIAEHVRWGVLDAGGFPLEFPGDVAWRDHAAAHGHALPQPGVDGRRGIDPRQPPGRRRPADGMRQDDAVADHGRRQRRSSDDRRLGRSDAARDPLRRADWFRHQHNLDERAAAIGADHARGISRGRGRDAPVARALHDDGHGLHDGVHGGGAGRRDARQRRHSRGGRAAQSPGARSGTPHRQAG